MENAKLKSFIDSEKFAKVVNDLYCSNDESVIKDERERYNRVLDSAVNLYGDGDYHFISSPGRVEICGNHTDHQRGNVVCASINSDTICVFKKRDDNIAMLSDEVFGKNEVDLSDLKVHTDEKENTKSLIRGIAARCKDLGYDIGGFSAYQDTRVPVGSGLSSSACFEILITEIYNCLYNNEKINPIDRAKISQYAENNYFGKACGLMDQMGISVGSFVGIDFYDKENPKVKNFKFSFDDYGYDFLIIDSKASHASLTSEYDAIPKEMKLVASYFGKEVLSEVSEDEFYNKIGDIRKKLNNDRAVLRAHHFFTENKRAKAYLEAIKDKNIDEVLNLMNESGKSSYMYLQNVYVGNNPCSEGLALLLGVCEKYLEGYGICRMQGGGFAGTIQVIVKKEYVGEFISKISSIFGSDVVKIAKIRNIGTTLIKEN